MLALRNSWPGRSCARSAIKAAIALCGEGLPHVRAARASGGRQRCSSAGAWTRRETVGAQRRARQWQRPSQLELLKANRKQLTNTMKAQVHTLMQQIIPKHETKIQKILLEFKHRKQHFYLLNLHFKLLSKYELQAIFYLVYKNCLSRLIPQNKPSATYLLELLLDIPKYLYVLNNLTWTFI